MRPPCPVKVAIIIPARNEAARIGACLHALAAQDLTDAAVMLVANNCGDGTGPVARACAAALDINLIVLDCTLPVGHGVGTARRLGCDAALAAWPDAEALLCTDADCLTAPDWIERNLHYLGHVAAVCGRVEPMSDELFVLQDMELSPAEMEGRYEALVIAYYRLMRPGPCGLTGDHGHAAGASLSVRTTAYRAVGGFADVLTGEDRDLVRRLKAAGHGVLHAGDVRVAASCRLDGRAQGGMSDALRARADRTDYLIDDALPPARPLIDAALQGTLGPWPLEVASEDRLRARDLAPQIALLEAALRGVAGPGLIQLTNP